MDAHYATGDDTRDSLTADVVCDCGAVLYPEERERELCRRCYEDFIAARVADDAYEKDSAA